MFLQSPQAGPPELRHPDRPRRRHWAFGDRRRHPEWYAYRFSTQQVVLQRRALPSANDWSRWWSANRWPIWCRACRGPLWTAAVQWADPFHVVEFCW